MKPLTRTAVYELLDGERAYQNVRWNEDQAPGGTHVHTPTEWLVYIQDYMTEAMHIASREDDQVAFAKIMDSLRKIGAMCVAAMEQNGARAR